MRAATLAAALLLSWSQAAAADIGTLLGRAVTDVRIVASGAPVSDQSVLSLVETRVGDALTMAAVRQTIDHFVTVGRYADVKVFAEADGAGVRVRYEVVPIARIAAYEFEGALGVNERTLRTELGDEFGAQPPSARLPELEQALVSRYQAHGYPAVRVTARLVPDRVAGLLTAVFTVAAGPAVVLRQATIDGDVGDAALLSRLGLRPGRPVDRVALDAQVRAIEEEVRAEGYYEAVLSAVVTEAAPGAVDVAVRGDRGDRVQVTFTGDGLPDERRRALVPITRLRSVDEEVVEDGGRNLEQFVRLEGYRAATVVAARQRANGVLQITFTTARGAQHVLGRTSLTGVSGLTRAELAPLMQLVSGEPFVDARVAAVGAALAEYYRVRGFAAVRVTPRLSFPGNAPGARVPVDVDFDVAEGARQTVTRLDFTGVTSITPAQLLESMALVVGKPYYGPQQALDRDAIQRRYRNLGFQRATVEARTEVGADGASLALTYVVTEGPQTRVDHVLVSGTVRISPDLVRREVTLQPGSPLGYDAVLESQQRLSALGLFRRVRITEAPHGADDARRDLLVEVEEAPSTSLSYGGGLELGRRPRIDSQGQATDRLDVAPRGFFEVTRRNLWGRNRSVSLLTSVSLRPTDPGVDAAPGAQGGYGLNQYRVIGTFREPKAFGTPGDAQVSAFLERGIRSSFNFDRRGVRADYARRLGSGVTLLGRYLYDFTTLFDTKIAAADQLLIDRLFPQVTLSALFGSALRDSRNDVLDPERGTVLGTDFELALRSIGSEVGFAKGFSQAFAYRRLPGPRPFVLAVGARLGLARGFEQRVPRLDAAGQPVLDAGGTPIVDTVNDLPAAERFFVGGDSTVRGFALDRLGTRATLNADGFPTGGNALVVLNAELRTPHVKGVGLVGFIDAGNVFRRVRDVTAGDMRAAAGVGFRYRSPLGPLRFDIGFKLDRRDFIGGTEARAVYHLSLGQAF